MRPRDLRPGLCQCFPNVSRCSGIVVISVCPEYAPKIRREASVTTETFLGKPCKAPKDLFPGAVYLSVDRVPPEPCQKKASTRVREGGAPRLEQDTSEAHSDMSLVTLAPRGTFRVPYWAHFGASVIW
ncbi:hypothetical protein CRG98_019636 [Punica granatum]|uniref:Uncharacterized protein n=1 Tax=Punica granatum TaxID=22663 RepID=A0A2I0JUH4_PUNGR|nr:hypothetical protein CRG98_019636 [Punica granatum]